MFSGSQFHQGKSQSPVSRVAERRETKVLEPIDKVIIGLITLDEKFSGERSGGNPHAVFDAAGVGNVAWSRYCDAHRRKGEITANTNFDLNWRACSRPYWLCCWGN